MKFRQKLRLPVSGRRGFLYQDAKIFIEFVALIIREKTCLSSLKTDEPEKEIDASLSELREKGLQVDDGIAYAAGDVDFYIELLNDFCNKHSERSADLQRFYEAEGIKDYEILIHAIKSNARMIGANELGEWAVKLESAASESRSDLINKEHAAFMDKYRSTVELIKDSLKP